MKKEFPLTDCNKNQVTFERRSGKERRKNRRKSDVVSDILNVLN